MIIGLTGFARSGKTTAARLISELYPVEVMAYADPLRDMLFKLNPWVFGDGDYVDLQSVIYKYGWDGYKSSPYASDIRRLIRTLGTDCIRSVSETFWVDALMERAENCGKDVLVHDVRFENEADAIRSRGGTIIRIYNPSVVPDYTHPSEAGMLYMAADVTITNSGSLEELKYHLDVVLQNML